ncbi:MAG: hypothetical protein GF404_01560 [candidate division Zixibacteria bacterium]|nr:hypothetical protein [candidate division Zixibacteria bacterium]
MGSVLSKTKINRISLILFTAVILTVNVVMADDVKDEMFRRANELIETATNLQAELFSPENYEKGMKHYHMALKDYEEEKSLKKIRENLEEAELYLQAAVDASGRVRDALSELIVVRNQAERFKANVYASKEFENAEKKFKQAALRIEDGKFGKAQDDAKEAEEKYRRAVIEMLKDYYLDDAEKRLRAVKKEIFKDTYKQVENKLEDIEEYLKYQSKVDFGIEDIFVGTYTRISDALKMADIEYPALEVEGVEIEVEMPESEEAEVMAETLEPEEKVVPEQEEIPDEPETESVQDLDVPDYPDWEPTEVMKKIEGMETEISRLLSPSTREKISAAVPDFESKSFVAETPEDIYGAAVATAHDLFERDRLGTMDSRKGAFLVLIDATRQVDQDLVQLTDEVVKLDKLIAHVADNREALKKYYESAPETEPLDEKQLAKYAYDVEQNWNKTDNLGLEYIETPEVNLREMDELEKSDLAYELENLEIVEKQLSEIRHINGIKQSTAYERRSQYLRALELIAEEMNK